MPKASSNTTLARQWEMLRIIPRRLPGITALEISKRMADMGYNVTKRTIERDLCDLSDLFPITSTDTVPPRGWYWVKDISAEFGGVEVTEAVSLSLSEDILKSVLPIQMLGALEPRFKQARKKLAALEDLPLAKWSNKVRYVSDTLPFMPPSISQKNLELIQSAIVEGVMIDCKYDALGENTKSYLLNPLGLVQSGVRTYLIATSDSFSGVRKLAIQRFRSVKLLDKPIEGSKDFSLDKFIESGEMQFGVESDINLKAILSERMASYLTETPISADQKINFSNGNWVITASVKNSWKLCFWILSQSDAVTVLSPKNLRDYITQQLKSALAGYGQ